MTFILKKLIHNEFNNFPIERIIIFYILFLLPFSASVPTMFPDVAQLVVLVASF